MQIASPDPSRGPHRRNSVVFVIHAALVLAAAAGWATAAQQPERVLRPEQIEALPQGWKPPIAAILLWEAGLCALISAPRWPFLGVLVYLSLLFAHPSSAPAQLFLRHSGLLDSVAVLAALGWAGWTIRRGGRPTLPRSSLTWLLLALMVWVGVCAAAAALATDSWPVASLYRVRQFVSAGMMFLVASQCACSVREWQMLGLTLGPLLCLKELLDPDPASHSQNVAAAVAMVLPLVYLSGRLLRAWPLRGLLLLAGLHLMFVLYQTRNRAAAVAVVVAVALLALQSSRRRLVLAVAAPAVLIGAVLFTRTSYWQRFSDIWRGGPDRASVDERLEIWRAGIRMFREQPLFGVGPGNFAARVGSYAPRLARSDPHNHLIAMLTETGLPGLVLYFAFFAGSILALWRVGRGSSDLWPAAAARSVVATLGAFLTVGFFLGLHTHALAFVCAGAAVALRSAENRVDQPAAIGS